MRRDATPIPVGAGKRMASSPLHGAATRRPQIGTGDTGSLDALIADLDEVSDPEVTHTEVDPSGEHSGESISQLFDFSTGDTGPTRVEGTRPRVKHADDPSFGPSYTAGGPTYSTDERSDPTPLPAPRPDETVTRSGADILAGRGVGLEPLGKLAPPPMGKATAEAKALAAIADLDDEPPAPPPRKRMPAPEIVPDVSADLARPRRGWVWALLALAGVGAMAWVISTQTDLLNAAAREREAARERAAAETARLTDELPDPGAIVVESSPDGAGVWLLLGRAPMTSLALPTGMVHQLRAELDGHKPVDLIVGGDAWTDAAAGDPDARAAARVAPLKISLVAGAPARPLPALPKAPPAAASKGLREGRGVIRVESSPPGAAVWLLVGITNSMNLGGIEAGRDYDLKVAKDGFVPGYVRITAEEWRNGGDPRLPLSAAPKKSTIQKRVELLPERRGR